MAEKSRTLIAVLIAVIAVLIVIILYAFVVTPKINGYVVQKQNEGIDLFIGQYILPQLQSQGYVVIPVGNQTLYLVPAQPTNATGTAEGLSLSG